MVRKLFLYLCLATVAVTMLIAAGCKVQITVPEGGKVVSQSGAFECQSGEVCTIDIYDLFFDEEFAALPAPGFTFIKWKRVQRGLCAD